MISGNRRWRKQGRRECLSGCVCIRVYNLIWDTFIVVVVCAISHRIEEVTNYAGTVDVTAREGPNKEQIRGRHALALPLHLQNASSPVTSGPQHFALNVRRAAPASSAFVPGAMPRKRRARFRKSLRG